MNEVIYREEQAKIRVYYSDCCAVPVKLDAFHPTKCPKCRTYCNLLPYSERGRIDEKKSWWQRLINL